jgi:hypothetical protein
VTSVTPAGNLTVTVAECLAEDEDRSLRRRQPLQQDQHPERDRIPQLHRLQRAERTITRNNWLRKPGSDVTLPARPGGGEPIQAQVGHDRRQPRLGNGDVVAVHPPQVGILDDVLGLGRLSQQVVRQAEQPVPTGFELLQLTRTRHDHPAILERAAR